MGKLLAASTIAAVKQKLGLPDSASHAEVMAAIGNLKTAPAATSATRPVAASADRPRRTGERAVDWALATGRISAAVAVAYSTTPDTAVEAAVGDRPAGTFAPSTTVTAASRRPVAYSPPTWSGSVRAGAGLPPVNRVSGADPRWYAINPALDDIMAQPGRQQTLMASMQQGQAPPTLFHSGDLPAFCASGIDPNVLKNVPWPARHRIAATADRARALELIEHVSGEEGLLAAGEFMADAENCEYRNRVENWAGGVLLAAQQRAEANEHRRIAAASTAPTKAAEDMTAEEAYEVMFGELDRQADARVIERREAIAKGNAWFNFGGSAGPTSAERRKPW